MACVIAYPQVNGMPNSYHVRLEADWRLSDNVQFTAQASGYLLAVLLEPLLEVFVLLLSGKLLPAAASTAALLACFHWCWWICFCHQLALHLVVLTG